MPQAIYGVVALPGLKWIGHFSKSLSGVDIEERNGASIILRIQTLNLLIS